MKRAHQINESGEFEELNDHMVFILDLLTEKNTITTRCLSAIILTEKCMAPDFCMHIRADDTIVK